MAKFSIPFFKKSGKAKKPKPSKTKQARAAGARKGPMTVYTALLGISALMLAAAVILVGLRNIEHSSDREGAIGELFKVVDVR